MILVWWCSSCGKRGDIEVPARYLSGLQPISELLELVGNSHAETPVEITISLGMMVPNHGASCFVAEAGVFSADVVPILRIQLRTGEREIHFVVRHIQ